jgi:hypothetical protein
MFRGKYLEKLKTWLTNEKVPFDSSLVDSLYRKNWVVYAKQPFLGPSQVLEYVGRYTHKVAISNQTPEKLSWQDICRKRLDFDPELCPCCGKGRMVTIERYLPQRGPPPPGFLSGP